MGYSFTSIEISEGESQTFQFNDGMPGGYENISISVRYGPPASLWGQSTSVNFTDCESTTVSLTGCIGDGCEGYSLD